MERERGSRSNARRRRRQDPRLRGLSYEERRRVFRRRRIGALLVIAVILVAILVLVGLIPLPGGASESGDTPRRETVQNLALSKSAFERGAARAPGAETPDSAGQNIAQDNAGGVSLAEENPVEPVAKKTQESGGEPLDVLVLGVDRRPEASSIEGSRTDTVMVVRVSPKTGEATMLSIPRDLFVEVEPGVEDRINAAYAYGGISQTSATVERVTGASIDHYAIVDFEGFEDIVDAVGGVTVEIQGKMPRGRHMEGTQTLDGEQALFYARYRGTPGGDLDRIKRQQQVVAALQAELLSWDSVSKLPEIVGSIRNNVDTDLGLREAVSLTRLLLKNEQESRPTALQLEGLPTVLPDGRQVLIPDHAANESLLREFRGEENASS